MLSRKKVKKSYEVFSRASALGCLVPIMGCRKKLKCCSILLVAVVIVWDMKRTRKPGTHKPTKEAPLNEGIKLTPRQQLFVLEYLKDFQPARAALAAGYSGKYISQTAHSTLQKPNVRAAIKEQMEARCNRSMITADTVIQELARVGFCDPGEFYDDEGDLKDIKSLPPSMRRAIKEVTTNVIVDRHGERHIIVKNIKLHSKVRALEDLAKHLGILNENFTVETKHKHQHNVDINFENLTPEEMQVLGKALGLDLLAEDDVCPPLKQ